MKNARSVFFSVCKTFFFFLLYMRLSTFSYPRISQVHNVLFAFSKLFLIYKIMCHDYLHIAYSILKLRRLLLLLKTCFIRSFRPFCNVYVTSCVCWLSFDTALFEISLIQKRDMLPNSVLNFV